MSRARVAFVIVALGFAPIGAQEPVDFPDANLKAAVEKALGMPEPTPTDMLGLFELNCAIWADGLGNIVDLTGLEYALNLRTLDLRNHQISSISALSGLTSLRTLQLQGNHITSISPLAGLSNLETLNLKMNRVRDISALARLSHLKVVSLHENCIVDISPLASLHSLTWLDLRENPFNSAAYEVYIPQIEANNPGIELLHDPFYTARVNCTVTLSATAGGSVIRPGEGTFVYESYDHVVLEAQADPGFVFTGWSGSFNSKTNPVQLVLLQSHQILASFARPAGALLYVDDDAPGDYGPGDIKRSDPWEDGTTAHPFDSLQEAIGRAAAGDSILVRPGTYRENIDLLGKSLHLIGSDPADPNGGPRAVLAGTGPVVSFVRNGPNCTLTGFVITGARGQAAGAILCNSSSPTVSNCLIVGNRTTGTASAAVYCTNSQAAFVNCTIADNSADAAGAAVTLVDSDVVITNSILWSNSPRGVLTRGTSHPAIRYCDVQDAWPGASTLNSDPLFARRGAWVSASDPGVVLGPQDAQAIWFGGDYHLQSRAGRWDPLTPGWVQDAVSSPGIDAGDRASPVGAEPAPNGGVINLGAYGGTSEASKSYTAGP